MNLEQPDRRAAFGLHLEVLVLAALLACAGCATSGGGEFRVDCNVPGATVWVDDVLVGRASEWTAEGRRIRPGFHRVEVRHPDYYSHYAEVDVGEGGHTVVKADLHKLLD